ncbi:MAG: hypothetical protein J07HX64_01780 [halophilic archaeon J07HX64]|jgi:Uncharacterized protein conserved in archaea|nr:MAG: hypothetical protein J07HX64_01780 [halophilic archaeon J07HX64]
MGETQLALATRCYVGGDARERAMQSLDAMLEDDIGELDAAHELQVDDDDFPVVDLSGPDAQVAGNLLRERWGEASLPAAGEVGTGTLTAWDEEALVLDVGTEVRVPRRKLGLGPGDPGEIRTRYGLVQHTPLQFVGGDTPRLADAERDRLYGWTRGEGRLNVNSATRAEVRATVNRAGHARDIVTVERLGLLEQSIVCKPDTDPPGLLASIGEYLPSELLCVVS